MTRQYIIILVLILLGGVLLVVFGRSGPVGPDNASTRTTDALKAGRAPVLAIVEGMDAEAKEYTRGLRELVNSSARGKARFIVMDTTSIVEKEALHAFPGQGKLRVVVLGLDGVPVYMTTGSYEPDRVRKAIEEALTKPLIKFPAPGEHSHSH